MAVVNARASREVHEVRSEEFPRDPIPSTWQSRRTLMKCMTCGNRGPFHIIPDDASVYSNFRFAFGDDTEEGRRFRKKEIKAIGEVLFAFKKHAQTGSTRTVERARTRR